LRFTPHRLADVRAVELDKNTQSGGLVYKYLDDCF
jgi:hypothetical protein